MQLIHLVLIIILGFQSSVNTVIGENNSGSTDNLKMKLHFEELKTNSKASLRGLYVVDENTIWASGSEGTVLKTTNGGENWEIFQIPGEEKNDFRSIHAWDKNRALVFGISGANFGYLTEDGGESWNVVYRNSTEGIFFNSIKFANEKVGLAISDAIDGQPFLLKTLDGGKSWIRIKNIPEIKSGEANFAASNSCIEFLPSGNAWFVTGGNVARVFYSDNFGEEWKVAETPITHGKLSSGIFSVSFQNENEGVIVGGIYDNPEVNDNIAAFTKDGGKTWISSETMPTEYRSCVQLVTSEIQTFYFTIGKTGCDYSVDGGNSWIYISNKGFYTFRSVPLKFIGFVAGGNGRISRLKFDVSNK